jgi:CHAT domain-containing protein/tetratricopeptide (TPR) repeat protein
MRSSSLSAAAVCLFIAMPAHGQLSTYEAALRYADVAALVEKKLAAGEPANTSLLWHLCLSYGRLKHYAKLFDCVPRLEARIAAGDTGAKGDYFIPFTVDARPMPGMLMAEAYSELGEYGKALAAGGQALDLVKDGGNDASTWPPARYKMAILPTLVFAAILAGERERALRFAKELEDTSAPFFGGSMHRNNKKIALARTYMALGEHNKAIENLSGMSGFDKLAMALADATNPFAYRGDSLTTMIELPRLLMLGKALFETGKPEEAAGALDQVLASPRAKDAGDLHWVALAERGRVAERLGKHADAIEFYRGAIEVIERQRSTLNTEASKIGFLGDKQAVYGRMVASLVLQGRMEEAFDYVERSKSRALVDMLASKKDFAIQAPDPAKVRLVLADLETAELASRIQSPEASVGGVRNLQSARETIRTVAPELASLLSVTSVPIRELRALVGEDDSLVEYFYFGADLFVFVVDRKQVHALRLEAGGLVEEIRTIRNAIQNPGSDDWRKPAAQLYQRLWQPIEAMVRTPKVVIVPHGALHYLPFAALASADGALLGERAALRFLPAASVLRYLRPATGKKAAQMLALGNPDLGDPRMDLQHAGTEAVAVAGMFQESRVLTRRDASETNFKRAGALFQRLHFATHGKFVADAPLDSGLHLAKDEQNDGVLTVAELYTMSLDADLVTLSACETGLGKVASGDDVVGLTRGFLYAGSRSIVASLWSVDDKATAGLMGAFYENLRTLPKDEALRQAQAATRRILPHPFFWAAFQLTGRAD